MKIFWCFSPMLFVLASCATGTIAKKHLAMNTQIQCVEGATRQGFLAPITTGDIPCNTGIQTCVANQWQGPMLYDSCENHTKNCNGNPHGSTVAGFLSPTTPHGFPCTPATKTCLNGQWSGPEVFPSCSEMP